MTNKFKFGDKVWHEEYGDGVYGKSSILKVTTLSQVMFESVGCINVLMSELTPATDWVKCSERMPEFGQSVTVYDGDRMWTDTTYDFGDGLCFYYDDDGRATHWMPLPAPPMEIAND